MEGRGTVTENVKMLNIIQWQEEKDRPPPAQVPLKVSPSVPNDISANYLKQEGRWEGEEELERTRWQSCCPLKRS